MVFTYPAVFRKEADSTYTGYMPDLKGISFKADSFDTAVREAHHEMEQYLIAEFEEEDPNLPPVSEPDDIELSDGEQVVQISVHYRFHQGFDE